VEIQNTGYLPVYVGQSNVSPFNGTPVQPGQVVKLSQWTAAVYACATVWPLPQTATIDATYGGTLSSSAATAGSTVLTLSGTVPAAFIAGQTFIIGNTVSSTSGAAEVLTVAGTATTSLTVSTALLFDHPASSLATVATNGYYSGNREGNPAVPFVPVSVRVNAGLVS
jgi:hypothetical protein